MTRKKIRSYERSAGVVRNGGRGSKRMKQDVKRRYNGKKKKKGITWSGKWRMEVGAALFLVAVQWMIMISLSH